MMKRHCSAPVKSRQIAAKRIWTVALGSALSLIALAGAAPGIARAQDSGSSDSGLFGSMLKSLGIGGENNIQYRERPPLVVPQTRDLPPPQPRGSVRNPNWPADPKSADAGKTGTQVRDLDKIPLETGPAPPPAADAAPTPPAGSKSLFGKLFNSSAPEVAPAPTPTRKSLVEPPLDYESPSPSQPYGITPPPAAPAKSAATPEGALQNTQPGGPGL